LKPFLSAGAIVLEKRKVFREKVAAADREKERLEREAAKAIQDAEALEQAAVLESQNEPEAAAAVIEMAAKAPAPVVFVQSTLPKTKGETLKKSWAFRIINTDLLPRNYLMPNEKAIQGVVNSLGDKHNIPGVEVYETETDIVRKAKK
jgi:hypothetical protein